MFKSRKRALLATVLVFGVLIATSSAANVTFECLTGWDLIGTHCYNFVNVQVDYEDAVDICDTYGAKLLIVRDEVEAGNVSTVATNRLTGNDHYWIYNGKDGDNNLINSSFCEGMWQPNEPRDTKEDVAIASNNIGRWALKWVWTNLPFVCRAPACPKGSFRCNDGACLNSKWKCDGTFDCQDNSDESDCSDNVKYFRSSTGNLDTTSIAAANHYQWVIEGQPGQVLKLEIDTLTLDNQVDSIRVYSGGASIFESDLIQEMRTSLTEKVTIFGSNHFLIVTLQSTNSKAILKATWSADSEVSVKQIETVSVTDTSKDIFSPYYSSPLMPRSFKKEWVLEAPENQLITLEVFNNSLGMNGDMDVFIATNAGFVLKQLKTSKMIYISNKNRMSVIIKTKTGKKFFGAHVRTGCNFTTSFSLATFSLMDLPSNLECSWTFSNELSTDFRLRIEKSNFDDSNDYLQLSNMSMVLATFNSSNAGARELDDLPSQITFKYYSDNVRPGNMIDGRISADCQNIRNMKNLNVTISSTSDNGKAYKADITCQEGFNFKQQEYRNNASLSAICNDGGMWDWGSPSYTRMPSCQAVYCGFPSQIRNGYLSAIAGNGMFNDNASYECFAGFEIKGSPSVTCQANGVWSQAPSCQAETCPAVIVVANASYNFTYGNQSDIELGTVVKYICDPGFDLLGAQTIVCLANKTWSNKPPSCEKLTCPLPMLKHGHYNSTSTKLPQFQESVTLSCDFGYQINRTRTQNDSSIICSTNRTLNFVDDACIDIDECSDMALNNCSLVSQTCNNNEGSYSCSCKSGFNGTDCQDIDECALNICDQNCTNIPGSYYCSCQDGYTLFTENGTNGFYIKTGENGLISGDVYQINKTCVPVPCKGKPETPENGTALISRSSYFYNETVNIICDYGYVLEGSSFATCQSNGNWTYTQAPICKVLTCMQPPLGPYEAFRVPDNTGIIQPGASLIISCSLNDGTGKSINKTLFCAPGQNDSGNFSLQGDDPKCPEVNCGPPLNIPGAIPVNVSQVYGSSFDFACDTNRGFTLVGISALGNSTVTCQSNGRWGYDNLTCEGSGCSDPGTMGGTVQIVKTSYEIDQVVEYSCTRPGFSILQNNSLVCDFKNGSAAWSSDPPMCQDTTAPVITCPSVDPLDLYSLLVYPNPNVTDNTGLSCFMIESGPPSGVSLVSQNIPMRYKAIDGSNEAFCEFNVTLKDYTAPTIECNATVQRDLADNKYEIFNLTEALLKSHSGNGIIKFDPEGPINLTAGSHVPVRASITRANGLVKECAFVVSAISTVCMNDSIAPPENGRIGDCTGSGSSMTCTAVCNDGFLYQNTSNSTSYSCTNGMWDAKQPLQPCLKLSKPMFNFKATLLYILTGNKALNKSQYDTDSCLKSHYSLLTQRVQTMSVCGYSNFTAINFVFNESYSDSNNFTFSLQLLTNAENDTDLRNCAATMLNQSATLFGPTYPNTTQLSCLSPWMVSSNITNNNIEPMNMSCDSVSTMIDYSNKRYCLPCGQGMLFNKTAQTCQQCQDGFYQNETGQDKCKPCPAAVSRSNLPRTSSKHCFELCPEGFTSPSGYTTDTCTACPEDHFYKPTNTCQPCPNNGSTLGVSGAKSDSQCRNPCVPGQYSITGYQNCFSCPINFYSNVSGSNVCSECPSDTYTTTNGSISSTSCLPGSSLCTTSFCNAAGIMPNTVCGVSYHRPVCTCKPGFYGDSCNNSCNFCNANPCYNDGVCTPNDGFNFTCTCKADSSCSLLTDRYITYIITNPSVSFTVGDSLDECKQRCLKNTSCLAILYEKANSICYQYTTILKSSNENKHESYVKNCSMKQLFDGPLCERDLTNDCNGSVCSQLGYCMDLIGGTKCQCPQHGNYDNKTCAKSDNPCLGNDCSGHGECVPFGSVRSVCVCYPGYTGDKCEVDIDECSANSNGCLSNSICQNGNNTYSCSCINGFSGAHCEVKPDLCNPNNCMVAEGGICVIDYQNLTASCTCGDNYMPDPQNPTACVQTNYCMSNPCLNSATCIGFIGGFKCDCNPGFEGSLCQHKIDECANKICQNGGSCMPLVNDYQCDCPIGFSGRNCENNTEDCLGNCLIANTDGCIDLVADYQCLCKPEFTGKNCSENVNECDLYEPCLHGGNCTDKNGGYSCTCPSGWTGSNCMMEQNYCNSSVCQNNGKCLNLLETYYCQCQDGTAGNNCQQIENLCEKYNSSVCAADGKCNLAGGTAECQCLEDYSGVACELQKNFCAGNPCNGGVCILSNSSYVCDCSPVKNFEGKNCNETKQVCNCPTNTPFKEYNDQQGYLKCACICPASEVSSGTVCTKVDTNYDLAFLEKFANKGTFVTSERGFVLGNSSTLTVAIWVAAAKKLDNNSVILELKSPSGKDPFLSLFNTKVEFSNNGMASVDLVDEYGRKHSVDESFMWHFIAVTWAANGEVNIQFDYAELTKPLSLVLPVDEVVFVHLGKSFYGYISQVSVWSSLLNTTERFEIYNDKLAVPQASNLLLGWTLYSYDDSVQRTAGSMASASFSICDIPNTIAKMGLESADCKGFIDKTPPQFSQCNDTKLVPTDYSIHQVSSSDLGNTVIDEPGEDLKPENQFFSYGAYDVAISSVDKMGNVGVCMTRAYITPNKCSSTEPQQNFAQTCQDNPNGRKVICPVGQMPSVPVPNFIMCSKLQTFNLDNMYEQSARIVCGERKPRSFTVDLMLPYSVLGSCRSISLPDFSNAVKSRFNVLNTTWPGLCSIPNCDNVNVTSSCNGAMVINAQVHISSLGEYLNSSNGTFSLTAQELMTKTVAEKTPLEVTGYGGSQFINTQAKIATTPSCDIGYSLSGLFCVQCGPGSYYHEVERMCKLCDIGYYTLQSGSTTCTGCPIGQTTFQNGTSSAVDCIVKCPMGQMYNTSTSACVDCPKNFYQDQDGKNYCFPCPPSSGTAQTGAKSLAECKDLCPPGTELKGQDCVACQKGFFRVGNLQDNCTMCPTNTTTKYNSSIQESECIVPKCPPGQYVQGNTSFTCEPCDYGMYQPNEAEFDCLPCTVNFTTENKGTANSSLCRFMCPIGHEESPPNSQNCVPCNQGFYRSGELNQRFQNCTMCMKGYTTFGVGSTNETDCRIEICTAGKYLNGTDGKCYNCSYNFYQNETSQQNTCKPCPNNWQTKVEGATSLDNCTFACPPGSEVDSSGANCTLCPRGTYKDVSLKFERCKNCSSDNITTDDMGATDLAMCNVSKCMKGYSMSSNRTCEKCAKGTYQDMDMPFSYTVCTPCKNNTTTMTDGSFSSNDCKVACEPGEENVNGTCKPCQRGTWNNGNETEKFNECQKCPQNYTTSVFEKATDVANCSIRDCQPGTYIDNITNDCVPCANGTYQNQSVQSSCLLCPANTSTNSTGSKDLSDCTTYCNEGYSGETGQCVNCSDDQFKDSKGFGKCLNCTGDFTSTPGNRVSCTQAFCDMGRELTGGNCSDCKIGFYKQSRGNSSCEPCPLNYTTAANGSTSATDCSVIFCEPGLFLENNTTCRMCQIGFFKNVSGNQNCTECQKGFTTDGMGKNSASDCRIKFCPKGQFRNASNECQACDIGSYQDKEGQLNCMNCSSNYTTQTSGSENQSDCVVVCPAGSYRNDSVNSCVPCRKGTYQDQLGKTECKSCGNGSTTASEGSNSSLQCYSSCQPGSRRNSTTQRCEVCPVGHYQNESDQETCKSCGKIQGYSASTFQAASTQETDCYPLCPPGAYLNMANRSCENCSIGFYKSQTSLETSCQQCSNGNTTEHTGETSSAGCTAMVCSRGSYRDRVSNICKPCPVGKYQNSSGNNFDCTSCPTNKTTLAEGMASDEFCIPDCPVGQEYKIRNRNCTTCPVGHYRPNDVMFPPVCYYCPSGTTTLSRGQTSCINSPSSVLLNFKTTVSVTVTFQVQQCGNPGAIRSALGQIISKLVTNQNNRYRGLCSGPCNDLKLSYNILNLCGTEIRNKRQAGSTALMNVTVSNIDSILTDVNGTYPRSSVAVLEEAFFLTEPASEDLKTNQLNLTSAQAQECGTQCIIDNDGMPHECSPGQFKGTSMCETCSKGTYSTNPVSDICLFCPGGQTTPGSGSQNITSCNGECAFNSSYCGNKGKCQKSTNGLSYCECNEGRTGVACSQRMAPEETDIKLVVGVCVGIGAFLLLLLLIVACCAHKRRKEKKKTEAARLHDKSIGSESDGYDYKYPVFNQPMVWSDPTMYGREIMDM